MINYPSKRSLADEIAKQSKLFIDEFADVSDQDKDLLVDGVDRTPHQMISYQLGWMNLILRWESDEKNGHAVQTPTPDFKWNNLGGLYDSFYKEYQDVSMTELVKMFNSTVDRIISLVNGLADDELFTPGMRGWASSTPSNWPVWKWIHINTVAPFKTFRTKMRKWKKLHI